MVNSPLWYLDGVNKSDRKQQDCLGTKRTHLDHESPHHPFLLGDDEEVSQSLCGRNCKGT